MRPEWAAALKAIPKPYRLRVRERLVILEYATAWGDQTGGLCALIRQARHELQYGCTQTQLWLWRRHRVLAKRILRTHGYPPDKQEKATPTVLEQAELLSEGWAEAAAA